MTENDDLELLRRRKMLELQKRLLTSKITREKEEAKVEQVENIDETLNKVFIGRAWEVIKAAERQYPQILDNLKKLIARLIREGKVKGTISGEQLMWLFRKIGLNVRLDTKIRIYESGELKSIAKKLREK